MQTLHEDPRELALRAQHDCHSHTHAIHVAFARLYRRAVPTPYVAAHYAARLPLVRAWVAARIECENDLQDRQDEDEQGQGEGGQGKEDTAEPEPEPEAPMEPEPPVEAAPSTARERGAQKDKHKNKELPRSVLGKRKASSTTKTTTSAPKTTATTTTTTVPKTTTTAAAAQDAAPATRATRSKHRRIRTEVERLLLSRGVDPPPPPAPASFTSSAPAPAPAPGATTSPPLPPPAEPPKPRTEPKKPRTVSANTKTKRTPKTSSKTPTAVAEEQYEFLPHTPFTTEVIVNRYPLTDGSGGGSRRKRGNEAGGARLDMARLGMMCMKASAAAGMGQKKGMVRAGRENCVVGGAGELVFLRRNKERVKRRLAAEARR